MKNNQLEALQKSIKKWENIVNGTEIDQGAKNCELCKINDDCSSCVIASGMHVGGCHDTPYAKWRHYYDDYFGGRENVIAYKVFDAKSKELAIAELTFLKSLLPEDTK